MDLRNKYLKETGKMVGTENGDFSEGYVEWLEQRQETGQVDAIVKRQNETINKLRGQLQNCVNHLHNAKHEFGEVIDQANKTLYVTLDA